MVVAGKVGGQFREMTKRAEEHGWSTVEQISVPRALVASGDDVVLYMSTTRDLWKFPIVDQSGTQVGSLDIWASSSCGEDCVQKGDGRDLWWFTPDHEPFNVLTYSARAPEDFNPVSRIMVGEKVTLGPNEHTVPASSFPLVHPPVFLSSSFPLLHTHCRVAPNAHHDHHQQSVSQSSGRSESKIERIYNSDTKDKSGLGGIHVDVNAKVGRQSAPCAHPPRTSRVADFARGASRLLIPPPRPCHQNTWHRSSWRRSLAWE
jgi:hypothetical protein